jgi:hypothetical protein
MTISLVVNNPSQTISLDVVAEQSPQSLSLAMAGAMSLSAIIADGSVSISSTLGLGTLSLQRRTVSELERLLSNENGMAIDFLLNQYMLKI